MHSTPVKGTSTKKLTLNWWEYWIGHCWMTGWQSIRSTFRIWCDLMSSRYEGYAVLRGDDPEEECKEWFWASINEDDVYPKFFLEELMQMADDVATGKLKQFPLQENYLIRLMTLLVI